MSSTSSTVTPAHFDYLAERAKGDDPFLIELKRAAEAEGLPPIWIAPEQGAFMEILLRLAGAREVVEVGTLAGYSAIRMARALPAGGRVRTIELEPANADFAERWVSRSDVAGRVLVLRGAGADVLPGFADASADAAFIDADKEGYARYLAECQRILRPGGLLMVDNAFAFGRILEEGPVAEPDSVAALRHFNDELAATPGLEAVIVPLGDGLWVGVKLA